jgi:hypothetical protein
MSHSSRVRYPQNLARFQTNRQHRYPLDFTKSQNGAVAFVRLGRYVR